MSTKPTYAELRELLKLRDEFGGCIDLGHTEVLCHCPRPLKLLEEGTAREIEIDDVDKGYLFYKLKRDGEFFVLREQRIGLYGRCGKLKDKIRVRELQPIIDTLRTVIEHKKQGHY